MVKSSHEQIIGIINWWIKRRVPFNYELQNETITIRSEMGSYTTANFEYTTDELNFIKKVKHTIISNGLYEMYKHRYQTEASVKRIKYFLHSTKLMPGMIFTNAMNIDLDSAYWETAFKYNLLPDEIYREGLAIRKQVRLTAIGSLAKKTRMYRFDGKKQKRMEPKRSSETEMLWALICDHVGKLITSVVKECTKDFIFFWVDGIYVHKGAEKKIHRLFKQAGYSSDITLCQKIEITDRHIWVTCKDKAKVKEVDGKQILIDTWQFPFRKKEIQQEMAGYNVDL